MRAGDQHRLQRTYHDAVLAAPTRPACTAATTPARASPINTGTQSAVTTAKAKRGVVVTNASVLSTHPAPSRCVHHHDTIAVHLVHPDDPVIAQPDRGREPLPVGGDGGGIVADVVPEIERVERRRGDTAGAGGRHAPYANRHGRQYCRRS